MIIPGQADAQSAGAAYSPDTAWVITSVNGSASVRSLDATVAPATQGATLAEGMTVTTGDGGRIVLNRAGDSITVSPNSEFNVGPDTANASAPNILQTLGTMLFSIDSSAGPRNFQVRTPYLAAVIKGTMFSVSVTPEGSALHVTEGLVQVADLATGQTGLVAVGQTARVSSSGGGGLNIDRGDGSGGSEQKKEGKNADPEKKDGKENSKAAEAKNKDNGKGQGKAKGNGVGLKIKAAIDTGIGDIAENTGGLVSMAAPGRTQTSPGAAAFNNPGSERRNVNARGPDLNKIMSARNNALNSNAGGNGNGNGNGNPNAGGNNAGGNGGGGGGGGNPNPGPPCGSPPCGGGGGGGPPS